MQELTRDDAGSPAPKQFCRCGGDRTLLQRALRRARILTDDTCVVPVVQAAHRRWWEPELAEMPRENVIEEPENRGTAVAILRALHHVLSRDHAADVVLLPTDHAAENEDVLCDSIGRAAEAAAEWPRHVILLGMEAEGMNEGHGWIVAEASRRGETAAVRGFYEKPDSHAARRLAHSGALISTFIMAARGSTLSRLYSMVLPELVRPAASGDSGPGGPPSRDFSRDFLERSAHHLRVLHGRPCGWSDLGTPARLRAWVAKESASIQSALASR